MQSVDISCSTGTSLAAPETMMHGRVENIDGILLARDHCVGAIWGLNILGLSQHSRVNLAYGLAKLLLAKLLAFIVVCFSCWKSTALKLGFFLAWSAPLEHLMISHKLVMQSLKLSYAEC